MEAKPTTGMSENVISPSEVKVTLNSAKAEVFAVLHTAAERSIISLGDVAFNCKIMLFAAAACKPESGKVTVLIMLGAGAIEGGGGMNCCAAGGRVSFRTCPRTSP